MFAQATNPSHKGHPQKGDEWGDRVKRKTKSNLLLENRTIEFAISTVLMRFCGRQWAGKVQNYSPCPRVPDPDQEALCHDAAESLLDFPATIFTAWVRQGRSGSSKPWCLFQPWWGAIETAFGRSCYKQAPPPTCHPFLLPLRSHFAVY